MIPPTIGRRVLGSFRYDNRVIAAAVIHKSNGKIDGYRLLNDDDNDKEEQNGGGLNLATKCFMVVEIWNHTGLKTRTCSSSLLII